ncbi:hypothetical protein MHBO_001699, partial [Bonamia ostreae]
IAKSRNQFADRQIYSPTEFPNQHENANDTRTTEKSNKFDNFDESKNLDSNSKKSRGFTYKPRKKDKPKFEQIPNDQNNNEEQNSFQRNESIDKFDEKFQNFGENFVSRRFENFDNHFDPQQMPMQQRNQNFFDPQKMAQSSFMFPPPNFPSNFPNNVHPPFGPPSMPFGGFFVNPNLPPNHSQNFPSSENSANRDIKILKVRKMSIFKKLSDFIMQNHIKNFQKSAHSTIKMVFESPPDDLMTQTVLKLSGDEANKLRNVYLKPEAQKPEFEELFEFLGDVFGNEVKRAAVVVDHSNDDKNTNKTKKTDNGKKDDILADLDKISDFLSNIGDLDTADIPGLGKISSDSTNGQNENSSNVSEKSVNDLSNTNRKNQNFLKNGISKNLPTVHKNDFENKNSEKEKNAQIIENKVLSTYSENASEILKTLNLQEKLIIATKWIRQCSTFTSFVIDKIKQIALNLIEELKKHSKNKEKSFVFSEKAFFAELTSKLINHLSKENSRLLIKTIKSYPGHLLLNLNLPNLANIDEKSQKELKKSKKPQFRQLLGICSNCKIDEMVYLCSWCEVQYCGSCVGNAKKPPCKNCQKDLTPFEKVLLYQTIPFERALRKIVNSFEKEKSVEETSFSLPLFDPFSFKRIEVPGKGRNCEHRNVFDVKSFLLRCNKKTFENCPVCKKPIGESDLEVDGFIERILATEPEDIRDVTVMKDGSWINSQGKLKGKSAQSPNSKNEENSKSKRKKKCIDLTF